MTRRLYWEDPYRCEFDARVVERLEMDQPALVLEATCFYPDSGGQPHDTGLLNGVAVVDVRELEGRIVHLLAEPLDADTVHGVVDWQRRFDHMQQHTGQHILSQAFERSLGASTVSFHLGEEASTIDLALSSLDEEDAARVEDLANRIVMEDRPVTALVHHEGEVASLDLRKIPDGQERVRVVSIEAFDQCGCGGTHVRTTGEVGIVHILRWERRRDQTRIEFACGWRAARDYRAKELTCRALAGQLSVGIEELPEAMARLAEAEQAARRQAESLRKRLLDAELPRLAQEAERVGGLRVLCRVLEEYDAGNMRYLAGHLTQEPGYVALLAVTDPSPQICFARSEDVNIDMGRLLREATAPYGGRGGGKPHLAQGGGLAAHDLARALQDARALLEVQVGSHAE